MPLRVKHLFAAWAALLILLAAQVAMTLVPGFGSMRAVVLLPSIFMASIVVLVFMEARTSSTLVRFFAVAGLAWLVILLSLGSMDMLTRTNYLTQSAATTGKLSSGP